MLRRDSPTPREHMSERLWMRDRMTLLHSVCHHHEFVKTSHRGSHETCSLQVLTEPNRLVEIFRDPDRLQAPVQEDIVALADGDDPHVRLANIRQRLHGGQFEL